MRVYGGEDVRHIPQNASLMWTRRPSPLPDSPIDLSNVLVDLKHSMFRLRHILCERKIAAVVRDDGFDEPGDGGLDLLEAAGMPCAVAS